MDWRQTRFENGLHLITIQRPGSLTTAVRVLVRAGSRYDGWYPGLSHLLEHILFKGTRNYSADKIFSVIESRGGEINAQTTREYMGLHTVTLNDDLNNALNVLADLICEPALQETSVQQEIPVITQEIINFSNQPGWLSQLFHEALFQNHPLSSPLLGIAESLTQISTEALKAYYQEKFVSGNTLISICGDIDHEGIISLIPEVFARLPEGPQEKPSDHILMPPVHSPEVIHQERALPQIYFILGLKGACLSEDDRSSLKLLETLLGMGGSGRLYKRLRLQENLVYQINTINNNYEDTGYLAVQASCAPENFSRVKELVLQEFIDLAKKGASWDELEIAKSYYTGSLARRFETNLSIAGIFGVEGLLNQVEPFEQAVRRIHSVDQTQIAEAAQRYLTIDNYALVSIGSKQC